VVKGVVGNQFGTSLSTHISNFDDIGQCWIFTAHFLYCVLAAILKMADISKFWKRRIAPLMVTTSFDMWVDYDVPNWILTSKNFYRSPFSKWSPQYCTNSTLFDFNDISYVGRLWCPELIPDIKKFLPVLKSNNVEFLRYCGGHFENSDR
jgi:hypothetical protein